MKNRRKRPSEPLVIESWLDRDEPTSDLYRLTNPRKTKTLRHQEEYRGAGDLRWRPATPLNYEGEQRRRSIVRDEMAAFLDRFKWDRFATYTTNMLVKPETVHTMFRHHLQFIEEKTHIAPYAFVADEYGVLNGRFHIHALIGNVRAFPAFCGELLPPREPGDKPRPCCGVHSWPGGYARVFVYDPEIKASGYVSKYVVKNFGHYDLIGDFVQVASPETQLSLISAERAESGPPDVPPRNS